MNVERIYNVGIYCRLSYEDKNDFSTSIKYQKEILTNYVLKNNWNLVNTYIDNGYTGTNFDRPAFNNMIADIEKGIINLVITKDLSRLGRDYKMTGYYIEDYFPSNNVRYIALTDNIDIVNEIEDELLPFRNLINSFYAKDVSKKIRFTIKNNIRNGVDMVKGVPLYGYMYQDGKRVINPDTAPIVKMIFNMYKNNIGSYRIAKELEKMKIPSPLAYNNYRFNYSKKTKKYNEFHWYADIITKMIKSEEYIGTLVTGKIEKEFGSNKITIKKEDERYYFKDKFEPIVDIDTWNTCQEIINNKKIHYSYNKPHFAYFDLLKCKYCGEKLKYRKDIRLNGDIYKRFICKSCHNPKKSNIDPTELEYALKNEIFTLKRILLKNKEAFINKVIANISNNKTNNDSNHKLEELNAKYRDINHSITKAFEKYASGNLPEEMYKSILKKNNEVKAELLKDISILKKKIEDNYDYQKYYNEALIVLKELEHLNENNILDKTFIHNLVSSVYISTNGKKDDKKKSYIEITYKRFDELIKNFK